MENELAELQKQIDEKKEQEKNIFANKQEVAVVEKQDKNAELIESMFEQAVVHEISTNEDLKNQVLDTAGKYTSTKMEVIKTNVDTEHKEAIFNNNKDACESYGFNEKTTSPWAIKWMKYGYNVMLAIYIFIASFTVMPIIFLSKKIVVAVKHTWIAILFAFLLYCAVTVFPIVLAIIQ